MLIAKRKLYIISVAAVFSALTTACDDSSTSENGGCIGESCSQECSGICGPSQKCFSGECHDLSEFCGEEICGSGEKCFEESCHPLCGESVCDVEQQCWQNNCYSISAFCGNIICGDGLSCFEGNCVASELICGDVLCSTGQKCFDGACRDDKDLCGNAVCTKEQTCVDGHCVNVEELCGGVLCTNEQKCYQDKCYDSSEFCGSAICEREQTCLRNTCVDSSTLCNGIDCGSEQKCYMNTCYSVSDFCGDVVCSDEQECQNLECITPVKTIEFDTDDTKLLFNETLSVNVKVSPANASDKTLTWMATITGPSSINQKDIISISDNGKGTTATLTNRTLNVREVSLTVTSNADPSVTATKTIQFKPYTKDVCVLNSADGCDKPRILHDANTRPYLPKDAYDEETTKIFNRDIYTEYVSKYLQKSGSDEYGNRASVLVAARFITLQFPFFIRYYDNTHTVTKHSTESHYVWTDNGTKPTKGQDVRIFGFNLTPKAYNGYTSSTVVQNNVIPWSAPVPGESDRNEGSSGNGLACSGFVSWALRNGRFYIGDWWTHVFGNYGDCTVSDHQVRHYNCPNYVNGVTNPSAANPFNSYDSAYEKLKLLKSTNQMSMCKSSKCGYVIKDSCVCEAGKQCSCACLNDKIGGDSKDDAINDRTDFVNVKYIDDAGIQKKIKAGDLLWHGKSRCTGSGGHIAMILGIERNTDDTIKWLYVAEAASGGTKVTKYSIYYLQNCSGWSETECEKVNGKYVVKKNSDGSVSVPLKDGKPSKAYDSFVIRMDNVYNYYYTKGIVSEKGNEYKYKALENLPIASK